MPSKQEKLVFWVTNVSKMDVSIGDLGLTIKSRKTLNLLDNRYYHFTPEELINSAVSGSLFKKKDKIKICKVLPQEVQHTLLEIDNNAVVPSRRRSAVKVEEIFYEELHISDEKFADETSELVDENISKK